MYVFVINSQKFWISHISIFVATTKNIYRGYPHFLILTKVLHTVGGPAEGAVIVHQEDNAPPHQEGDFHAWLVEEFQKRN